MEDSEKTISQFNDAMLQIARLDKLWNDCRTLRESGKLISLRWKLDSGAIELWEDANKLDKEIEKEDNKNVNKLNKFDKEIETAQNSGNKAELYIKLVEKEKILRHIQESSGKGSKFKSLEDDEM